MIPAVDEVDLWRMYALSRILQLLVLPHQVGHDPVESCLPVEHRSGLASDFAEAMGLSASSPDRFHPFDHEIVSVIPTDGPVSVQQVLWPRLMLGLLLIQRAGVRLAAPSAQIGPLAARSTLYWAYRRRLRPAADLSHGWGHNSQWRTSFRRAQGSSRS